MAANKTIVLIGHGIRSEAVAAAAITPGHLVELASTGKVQVHGTANGIGEKAFAVEDDLQGKTIEDASSADDIVQYNVMKPGEVVNAILANGQNASIGDKLLSAGDGTLQAVTSDATEDAFVCVALEALDLSGSSGADPASARIKVRIA